VGSDISSLLATHHSMVLKTTSMLSQLVWYSPGGANHLHITNFYHRALTKCYTFDAKSFWLDGVSNLFKEKLPVILKENNYLQYFGSKRVQFNEYPFTQR